MVFESIAFTITSASPSSHRRHHTITITTRLPSQTPRVPAPRRAAADPLSPPLRKRFTGPPSSEGPPACSNSLGLWPAVSPTRPRGRRAAPPRRPGLRPVDWGPGQPAHSHGFCAEPWEWKTAQRLRAEAARRSSGAVSPTRRLCAVSPTRRRACAVSPARRPCAVSPARRLCAVSPTRRLCAVSPARRLCAVSPARRLCAGSPTRRPCDVSPTRRLCAVSPTRRLCAVSPTRRVCAVSPTRRPCDVSPARPPRAQVQRRADVIDDDDDDD